MIVPIDAMRLEYKQSSLHENDLLIDPILQFKKWFDEAVAAQLHEPNAMTLATVKNNKPSARIVLLKEITTSDFIFYTNYTSRKANEISMNNNVAVVFLWHELERQVRIEGTIEKIASSKSDAYFYSRPISSQIGAIVSPQSTVIKNYELLQAEIKKYEDQPELIKRPPHWGGYALTPTYIEFWQGRRSRLHDRLAYKKNNETWAIERLAP